MTSKKAPSAAAPAVQVSKPPRRGLGEPPASAAATAAVGNGTRVAADDKLVDLGFKMPQEYRRNFRLFCASNDLSQVDAFREAMADYMEKKGWEPSK